MTPGNSPGQNTGVGSLSLLQGTFATQGSNPGVLHCRWILCQLSHKGSPNNALADILNSCNHNVLLPVCIPGGLDPGSILGSGSSPGEGNNNSSFLAWRIPWTEEPSGLQSMGPQESDTTERLHHHHHLVCNKEKITIC